jgi:DNA helicase IV
MNRRDRVCSLIDLLMLHWHWWETREAYYLDTLLPRVVQRIELASSGQRSVLEALREFLTDDEWNQLPDIVREHREGRLRHLDDEDLEAERRKHREAAEAETRRQQALEAERLRQAQLEEQARNRAVAERLRQAQLEEQARNRAVAERLREFEDSRSRLRACLSKNYLAADGLWRTQLVNYLTPSDLESEKQRFVQEWAREHLDLVLDQEQASAVGAVHGNVQLVARAGSGKTRTLVARAAFLMRHCGVKPGEILLLAFNKKAAQEMRDRLERWCGPILPHVMTYHALAYAIVHPDEALVFDDRAVNQLGQSREVQEVIDQYLAGGAHRQTIRELMMAHFRDDWEQIVEGHLHVGMSEFIKYRRALPRESLRGEYVKSFGERVIANALFEHGVEYRYERNFRWGGSNYRPDFTIPVANGGIVIEYFGLVGDRDYDELSDEKRRFWSSKKGWRFLEYTPSDLAAEGQVAFERKLVADLKACGVACRRRGEEEIWELIKSRAVDQFSSALRMFVSRARKRNLGPCEMAALIESHAPLSAGERMFLEVAQEVYRDYLFRLSDGKKEDFDGLMWRAIEAIRSGQRRFSRDRDREQGDLAQLRFVMIDEFQDVSEMFCQLIVELRSAGSVVELFCVGDDWQAINGFAGSDVSYFHAFGSHFGEHRKLHLKTNYRSSVDVVRVSNALMASLGEPADHESRQSGVVWLCPVAGLAPTTKEIERHSGDEITPAVLRLIKYCRDRGLDVVLLARRNGLPWYVDYRERPNVAPGGLEAFKEHVCSFLSPADRAHVSVSTVHMYKGLEKEAVIVIDAVDRSYPLVHPHWVFLRVFGDTVAGICEEERRLFYVALTRAEKLLAVVTDSQRPCEFVDEIRMRVSVPEVSWTSLAPPPSLDGALVEVRVAEAYAVRDALKADGFKWNASRKWWARMLPAEDFDFDALLMKPWAVSSVKIQAASEDGQVIEERRLPSGDARPQR